MINVVRALCLLAIIIISFYMLIRMRMAYKRNRLIKQLQEDWGKENKKYRNFGRISLYLNYKCEHDEENRLDDKTASDLNIDKVYAKIDRCRSKIGQQYLYYILQTPAENLNLLHKRRFLIDLFSVNNNLRINIEALLYNLNKHLTYSIPNVIFNWDLKSIKNKSLIIGLSLLPILLVALGFFVKKTFFLLIPVSFCVNLFFHYRNKSKVEFFITPFSQLKIVRDYCEKIVKLDVQLDEPEIKAACEKLINLGKFQFLLSSEKAGQNDFSLLLWLLLEYIKITFLIEINLLDKCLKIADSSRAEIHTLYKFIGLIDSCISISSYRQSLNVFCEPVFQNDDKAILLKNAYHPLIENCVPNDFDPQGKGVLITGSNMSGKTTFIRTVAINAILAQTIYTACAGFYKSAFLNVCTSIGIKDDILLGKSYYLEEIESIFSFIEKA